MAHARQQVRDAVVTAVTGLVTTAARVYPSRVYPMTDAELPGLCVYTLNEDSELVTRTTLMRVLQVNVDAYVKAVADYDDTIDTILAEIETAIEGNAALQALVKDIHLTATEIDVMKEGDKPIAIAAMTFMARYTTNPAAPETIT